MEVQQKKTNMSFKQLDGVIRTTDENGNRVNLSHKCTDLDKQMPSYLGVSKAILEHVVFCHQEDASWPLQEGAVLKKRFDDIFDSTRYTKALDVFSKLKKEYASKVKDIKADMTGYAAHLAAARGFRDQIEGYNEQLEDGKKFFNSCHLFIFPFKVS
jgi:DNA repair protein RAD50